MPGPACLVFVGRRGENPAHVESAGGADHVRRPFGPAFRAAADLRRMGLLMGSTFAASGFGLSTLGDSHETSPLLLFNSSKTPVNRVF